MREVFAVGDHVTVSQTVAGTISRIEEETGEIYVRPYMTAQSTTPIVAEALPSEEGPFTPRQVVPDLPSKRAIWRGRFGDGK